MGRCASLCTHAYAVRRSGAAIWTTSRAAVLGSKQGQRWLKANPVARYNPDVMLRHYFQVSANWTEWPICLGPNQRGVVHQDPLYKYTSTLGACVCVCARARVGVRVRA